LDAQGHLHLAPQLPAVSLGRSPAGDCRRGEGARRPGAHVLSAPESALWARKGWWPTWQAARQEESRLFLFFFFFLL
jgi:hypothetical protein